LSEKNTNYTDLLKTRIARIKTDCTDLYWLLITSSLLTINNKPQTVNNEPQTLNAKQQTVSSLPAHYIKFYSIFDTASRPWIPFSGSL